MTTGPITALRSPEAQHYLDGVAVALADLPEDDRADLLDELAAHVDELVAESDVPLADRLGSPADYAAELRTSAGLPAAAARRRPSARLGTRVRSVRSRTDVRAVEQFLTVLRPMWWVVRAWVVVAILAVPSSPSWSSPLVLVPNVGNGFLGLVLLVAAVLISVQTARKPPDVTSRRRWFVAAVNVVAAVGLVPVLAGLNSFAHDSHYRYYVDRVPPRHGVWSQGHHVRNLYVFDASGNPLTDVRLFDQRGRAVELDLAHEGERRQVLDSQGRLVDNAFPYQYVEPDGTVVDPLADRRLEVPPLHGAPAPDPSSAATPEQSAGPSASPSSSASSSPSGTAGKR